MQFCTQCDSKLVKSRNGQKCPKCDKGELEQLEIQKNNEKKASIISSENFPFEKGSYYVQKDVRKKLNCGIMSGINYNQEGNFIVIFMNAHELNKQETNPYLDRYDSETGLYHYTGKGLKGDQTLTGVNARLASSTVDGIDIHFFRQHNVGSNHEYVGLVKLEKVIQNLQPDEHGKSRKVYEFLLRPVE
ncbi:restriction endonuclease protein [Marine Group I thaumarchaeote SCGC AAA799-B03]|uniref:Restriction endonuclease protein n=3 Tax=Marine Group I TaxID=905826 RepID=A0A087S5X6_9ARCH|nr:restriction endonuclease protein [Marine Group I thaumarchaeote SCGC AAA799-N04]KFM15806.1 HNH endonuclease protein [Marine Group I thaumarchaeote SCGC RSA3]KFM21130.1 restriction endonuclease protein [Marine Group I thaumarchaeote SCGC AAA799-B03]